MGTIQKISLEAKEPLVYPPRHYPGLTPRGGLVKMELALTPWLNSKILDIMDEEEAKGIKLSKNRVVRALIRIGLEFYARSKVLNTQER